MHLTDRAYSVDYLGEPQLVIDDQNLLVWARDRGISLVRAQREALDTGVIPLRYLKNFWSLQPFEQGLICGSRILICGCGGLGGILIQLLARAGIGHMCLVDGDVFTPSNLNRQLLCDNTRLSRPKAQVAAERIRAINPLVEVKALIEVIDESNVAQMMSGMNLVLDALDNLPGRFLLAETAHDLGVPFIHAAVAGWWGQIATFLPQSTGNLEDIYGRQRARDRMEQSLGVLGPAAAVIGSLQAFEAIRLLSGREPAYVDQLLYFDGESGRMEVMPLEAKNATRAQQRH